MQARLFHYLNLKHNVEREALWAKITEVCLKARFVTQDVIPFAVPPLPIKQTQCLANQTNVNNWLMSIWNTFASLYMGREVLGNDAREGTVRWLKYEDDDTESRHSAYGIMR